MSDNSEMHACHRERMREKYDKYGADVFATHELLEMLLYFSVPRSDTNPAAHNLLDLCMTPDTMLRLDTKKLAEAEGIGEKSALLVKLSGDFSRRLLQDGMSETPLDSDFRRRLYLYLWYKGKGAGVVTATFLTKRNTLCATVKLSEGRMFLAEGYVQPIVDGAAKYSASKVIISHNHVNNVREASVEDMYLTEYIKNALASEGIELCAHYIVTDTDCTPTDEYSKNQTTEKEN